jgi:hypothetical protein
VERRHQLRAVLGTLAAAVVLAAAGAVSAQDQTPPAATCPPSDPQPATHPFAPEPDALVACVATRPIDGALFSHWYAVARKGSGAPAQSTDARDETMTFLVTAFWVEGEAAERNIRVPATTVTRTFNRRKRESFSTRAAFRAFMRKSGLTVADAKYEVRLDLLVAHIRRRVITGYGTVAEQVDALGRFADDFHSKWRAQTWCRAEYTLADYCG